MNLIVAVDKNWAIGQDNKLLAHIPEDMKFFREKTMNQVVIMGRKTLESFPGKNPLKNRINIVITTDKTYKKENTIIVSSIEEAIMEAKKHNKDIFVIGGASIYKQMLIFCNTAYITKIDYAFDKADSYFPNLDENTDWKIEDVSCINESNSFKYQFTTYKKTGG